MIIFLTITFSCKNIYIIYAPYSIPFWGIRRTCCRAFVIIGVYINIFVMDIGWRIAKIISFQSITNWEITSTFICFSNNNLSWKITCIGTFFYWYNICRRFIIFRILFYTFFWYTINYNICKRFFKIIKVCFKAFISWFNTIINSIAYWIFKLRAWIFKFFVFFIEIIIY